MASNRPEGRRLQRLREACVQLYGWRCWWCGHAITPGSRWHMGHVLPVSGRPEFAALMSNVRPSHSAQAPCPSCRVKCNSVAGVLPPDLARSAVQAAALALAQQQPKPKPKPKQARPRPKPSSPAEPSASPAQPAQPTASSPASPAQPVQPSQPAVRQQPRGTGPSWIMDCSELVTDKHGRLLINVRCKHPGSRHYRGRCPLA